MCRGPRFSARWCCVPSCRSLQSPGTWREPRRDPIDQGFTFFFHVFPGVPHISILFHIIWSTYIIYHIVFAPYHYFLFHISYFWQPQEKYVHYMFIGVSISFFSDFLGVVFSIRNRCESQWVFRFENDVHGWCSILLYICLVYPPQQRLKVGST